MGRRNRSAIRELADELREMRELVGELERKKKKLRKKDERRKVGERERKKIGNVCLMREEREV